MLTARRYGRARNLGAVAEPATIARVLSIAGSDSGGGAGIQADLKAFAACGVHGMTAITAITAQNTVGVTAVESVSPKMVIAQVRAVLADIGVDAVKVGMLGTSETIEAVRLALAELEVVLEIAQTEGHRATNTYLPRRAGGKCTVDFRAKSVSSSGEPR